MKIEENKIKEHSGTSFSVTKTNNVSKIDFGDKRYKHFKDTTDLKLYSDLDNNDKKRQKNYCKRSGAIKDKNNKLTKNNKESSNYYSRTFLWSCDKL